MPTEKPTLPEFRRANETIAIVPEDAAALSLWTRRIYNVLLYYSYLDGEGSPHRRTLGEIRTHVDYTSSNFTTLKAALFALQKTQVNYSSVSSNGKRSTIGATTLMEYVEIQSDVGKDSVVEWALPEKLRKLLAKPEQYTTLTLQMHTQLKAGSSVALFETCARYRTNPSGLTMRQPWEWWRAMLTGSKENAMEYKYFKRDIITPAMNEVNHHADFTIDLVQHKEGQRVADLQFKIEAKPQGELSPSTRKLLEDMEAFGISPAEARQFIDNYMPLDIEKAVQLTTKRNAKKDAKPLVSVAAFFKAALRNRYKEPEPQVQTSLFSEEPKDAADRTHDATVAAQHRSAYERWKDMDSDQQRELIDAFKATDLPMMVRAAVNRDKLESMIARSAFTTWMLERGL